MGKGSLLHRELHRSGRIGWLRAAVLGSDDGIVSVASLMIGVAAANASRSAILVAGVAGLVAGAMSMATGEYVSVASQRDAEHADIARERREQMTDQVGSELAELTDIYIDRGVEPTVAGTVATQLMAADPLGSHLRDELGIGESALARPTQAAVVSALSFMVGGLLPILVMLAAPSNLRAVAIAAAALLLLGFAGAAGAYAGAAPRLRAAVRVTVGGGLAMIATALIGTLIGAAGL
jgi:VIT1/CCC1 family predicted Fe2+/Mn2+ transporter